jgi:hypothetical protein
MALAQASSGVANGCPTPGTILTMADDARQGSATKPQPESGSERHAKTRRMRILTCLHTA